MTKISEFKCPVCPVSDLFSKKWLHPILMELYEEGTLRYGVIKRSLSGISPKTLTERLRELEGLGVVERVVFAEVPLRVEYSLTKKGHDLCEAILKTCDWVRKWYPETV